MLFFLSLRSCSFTIFSLAPDHHLHCHSATLITTTWYILRSVLHDNCFNPSFLLKTNTPTSIGVTSVYYRVVLYPYEYTHKSIFTVGSTTDNKNCASAEKDGQLTASQPVNPKGEYLFRLSFHSLWLGAVLCRLAWIQAAVLSK